jgi:hypothetical protein
MFSSSNEPVIHTHTDQVSVTVVRKSDGQSLTFVLDEKTHIHDLIMELKKVLMIKLFQVSKILLSYQRMIYLL